MQIAYYCFVDEQTRTTLASSMDFLFFILIFHTNVTGGLGSSPMKNTTRENLNSYKSVLFQAFPVILLVWMSLPYKKDFNVSLDDLLVLEPCILLLNFSLIVVNY